MPFRYLLCWTGLWAIWAWQHVPYTHFLSRLGRKKLNLPKLKRMSRVLIFSDEFRKLSHLTCDLSLSHLTCDLLLSHLTCDLLLSHLTCDLSQAEKKITVVASWATDKMITIFTHYDNFDHLERNICQLVHLLSL